MKNRLVKVHCSKCKRFLLEARLGSETYCPRCGVWTKADEKSQTSGDTQKVK